MDYPCGQRLEPSLKETDIIERLRTLGELNCSDEVAEKLKRVSAKTIDQKLKHQKEVLRQLQKKGQSKATSLLLKKIPIKIHGELDNQQNKGHRLSLGKETLSFLHASPLPC